ncbi:hypothetical protein EV14_0163 [Prochlorococcus sp. MIT 0703]|nr:hypothetical protein EV12_0287 [Prochlorococcus sp. MIT 0701]KGG36953.1 hypothetical protein EV14_0163 [Prochlorococcus sp. MIT 0703]
MVCLSEGHFPHNNLKLMTNEDLSLDKELTQEELSMLNGSRAYRLHANFPGAIILAYKDWLAQKGATGNGGYYLDGVWIMA